MTRKFFLRLGAALGLVALVAACATGPRVRTDYDPSADFAQYKTWGWYTPIAMEQSGYSSWISERIREDVRREMESRGYRYAAEGADLLVMGGYSHSRLREMILGGVTRHMLEKATLPLLLAH